MLPVPRIVVLDDEQADVNAILTGLFALGAAAVGLCYSPPEKLPKFPYLRILFLDLHIMPGAGDTDQQIKTTIGIMADILAPDNGPYAVVLWSMYADECSRFHEEVQKRLPELERPLPLSIVPLDKTDHLSSEPRRVKDPDKLKREIQRHIAHCPQLAALVSWEEHVSRAAGDAISQLAHIARRDREGDEDVAADLDSFLGELAVASAGFNNVKNDVFRAANDVMVHVLADRLLHKSTEEGIRDTWNRAVTDFRKKSELEVKDAARLNRFLHVEMGDLLKTVLPWERASVLELPEEWLKEEVFSRKWGFSQKELIEKEFKLTFSESEEERKKNREDERRWILVQIQPSCDHAQQNRGLLPYVLGLSLAPSKNWFEKTRGAAIWISPRFSDESGKVRCLALHLRFVTGLLREDVEEIEVCYRLREQLLDELAHKLHSYSGRPGIIRFPR